MKSPNTTTGWNATAGSNFPDHLQKLNYSEGKNTTDRSMAGNNRIHLKRLEFYRTNYDHMTGVRIAATLGGFFLFVLLTLLYKSKCKKSYRDPTPEPMFPAGQSPHPDLVVLTSNPAPIPIEEVNPMLQHHLFLDQQPGPSRYNNHFQSPKLLLTAAHDSSESSIESEISLSGFYRPGSNSSLSSKYHKIPPIEDFNYKKKPSQPGTTETQHKISRLQQNIDIHVIQPTPTISPSGSANIVHKQSSKKKFPKITRGHKPAHHSPDSEFNADGTNPLFFLQAESLSIKYMDDTSSENIPTKGSADVDEDDSAESLGSDSVFSLERKASAGTSAEFTDEGDSEVCRVTLTEAHAQVHHRDSYCSSEYESVTDYLECHRRRSSSTQTTWSDLRQCLGFGHCSGNASPQFPTGISGITRRHNSAGHEHDESLGIPSSSSSMLLKPTGSISCNLSPVAIRGGRKESTNSLQERPALTLSTLTTTSPRSSLVIQKDNNSTQTVAPSIPMELSQHLKIKSNARSSSSKETSDTISSTNIASDTTLQQQGNYASKAFQTTNNSLQCDDEQQLFKEQ